MHRLFLSIISFMFLFCSAQNIHAEHVYITESEEYTDGFPTDWRNYSVDILLEEKDIEAEFCINLPSKPKRVEDNYCTIECISSLNMYKMTCMSRKSMPETYEEFIEFFGASFEGTFLTVQIPSDNTLVDYQVSLYQDPKTSIEGIFSGGLITVSEKSVYILFSISDSQEVIDNFFDSFIVKK